MTPLVDTAAVSRLGAPAMAELWRTIDGMPPIAEGAVVRHLGVAHGWASFLLATLRWCRIARVPMPPSLVDRLEQLAALARTEGLGARWPWTLEPSRSGAGATMPGWCKGSAGFVHLWTTAHTVLGDDRWEDLALKAAWDCYATPTKISQLCCGLSGQAYALLAMYTHTGQSRWLSAASELGTRAATGASPTSTEKLVPGSLHKGTSASPSSLPTWPIRKPGACRSSEPKASAGRVAPPFGWRGRPGAAGPRRRSARRRAPRTWPSGRTRAHRSRAAAAQPPSPASGRACRRRRS